MKETLKLFLFIAILAITLPTSLEVAAQQRQGGEVSPVAGCWREGHSSGKVTCFERVGRVEWLAHKCRVPTSGQTFSCEAPNDSTETRVGPTTISTPPVHRSYQDIPTWQSCRISGDGRKLSIFGQCSLVGSYDRAESDSFETAPERKSKGWLFDLLSLDGK